MAILDKQSWLAAARQGHANTSFGLLGGEVVDVDETGMTVRLPITDAVRQPFGLVHGGMYLFLIETAASSHAAFGIDLDRVRPVGVEINGSHVRSATEGTLKAVSRVVRRGRTHIVHEVDVLLEETGELLCKGRMTNYYKEVNSE
jgi:uncharacterized protein (TIGR00369 family)